MFKFISLSFRSPLEGFLPWASVFPFDPADKLEGHFKKPLESQTARPESAECCECLGSTEVGPSAGRTTEAQGGVKVKWPVVCGLAGRMPGA